MKTVALKCIKQNQDLSPYGYGMAYPDNIIEVDEVKAKELIDAGYFVKAPASDRIIHKVDTYETKVVVAEDKKESKHSKQKKEKNA